MKIWERVELRLRDVLMICEQLYGFMPTRALQMLFALGILMYKYSAGQKKSHCVCESKEYQRQEAKVRTLVL